MKNPDRKTVSRLEALPNIGEAIARDLCLIGIGHPKQLIGKDPYTLYQALCTQSGQTHDPCVLDVFIAAVDIMEGGSAQPWWTFTAERKRLVAERQK